MNLESEIQRLQQRVRVLYGLIETSAIINSSLDLDEVLRLVLEKAQEVTGAEASAILLYNPQTKKLEFEVALGEKGGTIQSLKEKITLDLGQGIAGTVAQTRRAEWVPDAARDPRVARSVDATTGFVTRNILCAPLLVQERLIGVAEVMNIADPKIGGSEDLEVFETFCRQVAVAIENARLHKGMMERERERQQLEIAAVVQQSFLPSHFPTCPRNRFQVDAQTIPASVVGGDLYDFPSRSDDWLALAIGDVSGKGVPAALFMAMLISDLRFTALKFCSPGDVLRAVNAGLATRARRGMFVTMQYLLLDAATGAVRAANGGHVPLMWYHRRTGTAEPVELPGGPPLGILPEAAYPETTLALEPGDILLLLTDGVLESMNARGDTFGLSRLTEVMEAAGTHGRTLLHPVLDAVEAFAGGRRHDDLTVVELRWG